MAFADVVNATRYFITKNSPAILTGVAVAGVATTAILAGRGAFKAGQDVLIQEQERDEKLLPKEVFQLTWRNYVTAAAVGVTTILCVIGAQKISSRRTAALAGLYSLSEKAFEEYREKVVEELGKNKDRKILDAVAQDDIRKNPPEDSQIIFVDNGVNLIREQYTGRYFHSSVEKIRKAVNDLNAEIINGMGGASLNDFYNLIGLAHIDMGDYEGWSTDNLLEIGIGAAVTENDTPCIVLHYNHKPKRNYDRPF